MESLLGGLLIAGFVLLVVVGAVVATQGQQKRKPGDD